MYEDYVSTHARVLEGVRSARVQAIREMRLPEGQYQLACVFHEEPADALWVHADSGTTLALCAEHLSTRIAEYRRNESYPPVIVPLKRTGP